MTTKVSNPISIPCYEYYRVVKPFLPLILGDTFFIDLRENKLVAYFDYEKTHQIEYDAENFIKLKNCCERIYPKEQQQLRDSNFTMIEKHLSDISKGIKDILEYQKKLYNKTNFILG